jgi:hypothetical protein
METMDETKKNSASNAGMMVLGIVSCAVMIANFYIWLTNFEEAFTPRVITLSFSLGLAVAGFFCGLFAWRKALAVEVKDGKSKTALISGLVGFGLAILSFIVSLFQLIMVIVLA